MLASTSSYGIFLAFAALVSALPIAIDLDGSVPAEPSNILPRAVCGNDPNVTAGTQFPSRSSIPTADGLEPRDSTGSTGITWCAVDSDTYIVVKVLARVAGPFIEQILEDAHTAINERIQVYGDSVIRATSGQVAAVTFNWLGQQGHEIHTWNRRGQVMTWGVLSDAILSLFDYMDHSEWGSATFKIFDRGAQVGTGTVG